MLGIGGEATVFRAVREDGRPVAVRVPRTEGGSKLEVEALALREIGAPAVPELIELGHLRNGIPFLATELLPGPTLADVLRDAPGALPPDDCVRVLVSLAQSLSAVHESGWLHLDVTPENVFWDGQQARLIDFGVAARIRGATAQQGGGTPEYMAPEQCEGRPVDPRTDLYSLGAIGFELVMGVPPFFGEPGRIRSSHLDRRPPAVPNELGPVSAVITRCLAKRPVERPSSAAEIVRCLTASTGSSRVPAISGSASHGSAAPKMRRETVALVHASTRGDPQRLRVRVEELGGRIAQRTGEAFIVLFGPRDNEVPVRSALSAVRVLFREGAIGAARVDVCAVNVHESSNGSSRHSGRALLRPHPPTSEDAGTVVLTHAAQAGLPGGERVGANEARIRLGELDTVTNVGASTSFVGHPALLTELDESFQETLAGAGAAAVTVVGDSGFGKTRLLRELAQRLATARHDVLVLEPRAALERGRPLTAELLSHLLALPESAPADRGESLLSTRLQDPSTWPAVALELGWIQPHAPELEALRAAPGAIAAALVRALAALLVSCSRRRPLALLLDDAHLADEATLAALDLALGSPGWLWVLAAARAPFDAARPTFGERARRRARQSLPPLCDEHARELARALFLPAADVPQSAIDLVVARTRGVPEVMVELIRALKREGVVRRTAKGEGWYLATDRLTEFPESAYSLDWLARREIESTTTPDLAAHAQLLGLVGGRLRDSDIGGILGEIDAAGSGTAFPLDAIHATEQLVARGILERHRDGTVSFRTAVLGEAAAAGLPGDKRAIVHRAVWAYLHSRTMHPEHLRETAARHAALAGLHSDAFVAYAALAEAAAGRHRWLDAERLASGAIELAGSDSTRLLRLRGTMRARLGRYDDALADFSSATSLLRGERRDEEAAGVLLDEAMTLDWMDEYRASTERARLAMSLMGDSRNTLLQARAAFAIGRSLHREDREREAAEHLREAACLAEACGDSAYETRMLSLLVLGFVLQGLGRCEEAATVLEQGLRLCEAHGDRLHLMALLNNRALLHGSRGDAPAMLADFRRVQELARELGQPVAELVAEYNLAEYLVLTGRADEAEAHALRAREIDRRRAGDQGRPIIELLFARMRFARGAWDGARDSLREIERREAISSGPDSRLLPSEHVLHLALRLALDGPARTAVSWDEVDGLSSRVSVGQERIEILAMRAASELEHGDRAGAARTLERASSLCEEIPNVLGPRLEKMRESVLLQAARSTNWTALSLTLPDTSTSKGDSTTS